MQQTAEEQHAIRVRRNEVETELHRLWALVRNRVATEREKEQNWRLAREYVVLGGERSDIEKWR